MYFYAQINESGRCYGVSQLSGPVESPNMIPIGSYDESYLGRYYIDGQWQ